MATVDGANYIAVSAPDITMLDDAKEKFFDYIQDPKREVEIAAATKCIDRPIHYTGYGNTQKARHLYANIYRYQCPTLQRMECIAWHRRYRG